MSDESWPHIPVLLDEVVEQLRPAAGKRFIDGTLGAGGHSAALLAAGATVLGLDLDREALALAQRRLAGYGDRFFSGNGNFAKLEVWADRLDWQEVDGILFDLGVSSMQIDEAIRGFSFQQDGPLDMRMDLESEVTASRVLNTADEDELALVFRDFGEVQQARRIARRIIAARQTAPWERTQALVKLIDDVVGFTKRRPHAIAAQCFQALRIVVNDELANLELGLAAALRRLRCGGRLAVIAFHSLEDRIVKHTFREEARSCVCPPELPVCCCDKVATVKVLTRSPIRAGADELAHNPRAASARLRVAEAI